MSDGLYIKWRETAPDRGLLSYALSEIESLHQAWPETMQCNIVIERAAMAVEGAERGIQAHVEIDLGLGRRAPRIRAKALRGDAYAALRTAFSGLRDSMPAYQGHGVEAA